MISDITNITKGKPCANILQGVKVEINNRESNRVYTGAFLIIFYKVLIYPKKALK
jgi:hypothetical protein